MLKIINCRRTLSFDKLERQCKAINPSRSLFPGEPVHRWRTSYCLTFDHCYFSFYHFIFPLLKRYQLKALLGVTTNYIIEQSACSYEERLAIPHTLAMQEGIFETKAPFCTWQELEEMVASGHVTLAAHSHLHCNLTFSFVDLSREIEKPKHILEKRIDQKIESFIYPFGRYTSAIHAHVQRNYTYAFSSDHGMHFNWNNNKRPLRRLTLSF